MNKSVSGIKNNNRSVQDIDINKQTQRSGSGSEGGGRPPRRSHDKRIATYGMWFIGIVVLLLLFFLFSIYFSKTTVTVTPRTAPISVDGSFTAQPPNSNTTSTQTLTYSVISVSDTVTKVASSTRTEYREARARGQITIYNEYSDQSINLVPNTRFKAPNGKIYRTQSTVTVPGQSSDGSPGQVTVPVVAAKAGQSYNLSGDVRFSVPGFSGMPQEGLVYGRLSTPIDGGVARKVPIISTSTQQQIVSSVSESLREQLATDLKKKIPASMVTYDNARFYSTESNLSSGPQSQAEISVTGNLKAVGFGRRELSVFLANNSGIEVTNDTSLRIRNLEGFDFNITNSNSFNPSGSNPLQFTLTGNSLAIWQYNKQALARDLQSLQRNQVSEVMSDYRSIQSATVKMRPFWKRRLPQNPSAITITTELPQNDQN